MPACVAIITPEELYAVSQWHTFLSCIIIVILLVVCILLVATIRINLKQGAQVQNTRTQVNYVLQAINKLMKGALSTQKGTQDLVHEIPQKVASVLEKAVKDSEIIRKSDPPLAVPLPPRREVK